MTVRCMKYVAHSHVETIYWRFLRFSGQIVLRSSGIGRSGLFRLCCVKLGTHFAEQALGAPGEGFAKLPLAHGLVKVESAGLKCLHGLKAFVRWLRVPYRSGWMRGWFRWSLLLLRYGGDFGHDHAVLQCHGELVAGVHGVRIVDYMAVRSLHYRITSVESGLRAKRGQ